MEYGIDPLSLKQFKINLTCEFSLADILEDMGLSLEQFAKECPLSPERELKLHAHLKAMLKRDFNDRIDKLDANDIESVRS